MAVSQKRTDNQLENLLWRTSLARKLAGEIATDRQSPPIENDGNHRWLQGWKEGMTHAYVVACSVLESSEYDNTELQKWSSIDDAEQWPSETVFVRRWKSRESGKYCYAVSTRVDRTSGDGECEFLRIE